MSRRHAAKQLGQAVTRLRKTSGESTFPPSKDPQQQSPRNDKFLQTRTPHGATSTSTKYPELPYKKPRPSAHHSLTRHRTPDPRRHFGLNTLDPGIKPRREDLIKIRGQTRPGPSSKWRVILKGRRASFPGKRAYLLPASWTQVGLGKTNWVEVFELLQGPLETKPLPSRHISLRPNSMNFVQVASTPTADTGGSLMLHFDHRRYLFGQVAEGTQRALTQRKFSLAKLEMMFLSGQTRWENTGGLIGMMLTTADIMDGTRRELENQNATRRQAGKRQVEAKRPERIEIHGAHNLNYSIATARFFIFRQGMPIRPIELGDDVRQANPSIADPDWEDDSIQVWKVPIHELSTPSTSRKRSHEVMTAEDEAMTTPDGEGSRHPHFPKQDAETAREAIQAVVEDMFNSNWSRDTLYETKLSQVQLPATLFVRDNGRLTKYKGPMPGDTDYDPHLNVLVRFPWPASRVRNLPRPVSESGTSLCYIVKNRGRRGKFNPVAAKELGVKIVDYKLLTAGQTVKGKDGIDVTPDMVVGERVKPKGFALLDVANTSCVESFLARPEWKNSTVMENVPIFFWLLGPSVLDDPRIQSFMKERPDVKHIVMARGTSPNMLAMDAYAVMLAKLRRIDPDRFPVLDFDNTCRDLSFIGPNVEAARVGMKAVLSPDFILKNDEVVPFPTFSEVGEMDNKILDLASQGTAQIRDPGFLAEVEQAEQDIPNRDAEIVPLGTGSALPSKYRNVSSTLIRVPQYGNYLLDCGENTIGQLRRAFGEETTAILQSLRCVFISHMHADHQLGTVSLLKAWWEATAHLDPQPELTLSCPRDMKFFLLEYFQIEPEFYRRLEFHDKVWPASGDMPAGHPSGLSSLVKVPVDHCRHAFAGVLAWPSGLKVAYSGDCRPSDALAEAGRGATLLVHESTFDDNMAGDALAKKHSTVSEALDVADRMGARRVLLTHFSQRYARVPILRKSATGGGAGADQAVLLAFDQMRVKLGEFRQAQAFLPAIKRLFELEMEEAETATEERKAATEEMKKSKKGGQK